MCCIANSAKNKMGFLFKVQYTRTSFYRAFFLKLLSFFLHNIAFRFRTSSTAVVSTQLICLCSQPTLPSALQRSQCLLNNL